MKWDALTHELPVGDIKHLRGTMQLLEYVIPEKKTEFFFRNVLVSYYDCMFDGLSIGIGDFVYRLSDRLTLEERQKIPIYPSKNGTIIVESTIFEDNNWLSLEQWRNEWSTSRKIPEMSELLKLNLLTDRKGERDD